MSEIESSLYIVDNMCFGEEISISEVQETYFTNISSISGPSLNIHSDLPLAVTTNVDTGPKFNFLKAINFNYNNLPAQSRQHSFFINKKFIKISCLSRPQ